MKIFPSFPSAAVSSENLSNKVADTNPLFHFFLSDFSFLSNPCVPPLPNPPFSYDPFFPSPSFLLLKVWSSWALGRTGIWDLTGRLARKRGACTCGVTQGSYPLLPGKAELRLVCASLPRGVGVGADLPPSPLLPVPGCGCCCLIAKSCPTLCDPMDCSMTGSPVFRSLLEFAQIHVR